MYRPKRISFWIFAAILGWYAHDGAHSQTSDPVVFVDNETPAGVIDGRNHNFQLASIPIPLTSLHLYRNGLRQRIGGDFTVNSAGLIAFVQYPGLPAIPGPQDKLVCDYRK